jgi:hypothetical protein
MGTSGFLKGPEFLCDNRKFFCWDSLAIVDANATPHAIPSIGTDSTTAAAIAVATAVSAPIVATLVVKLINFSPN